MNIEETRKIENDIFQKVKTIILKNSDSDELDIFLDTRFDNLGIDSLDILCILIDIEKEYKISIDEKHAANIEKVEDVINLILNNNK